MAIRVRFDKNGWYHPAFGRLGRADDAGTIYSLPDVFGERETVEVPIMDPKTRQPTGEVRKRERFKFLPSSAEIVDDDYLEELKEEAFQNDEPEPAVVRPKMDDEEAKKVPGKGKTARAQSAVEKTTGRKSPARRSAAKE